MKRKWICLAVLVFGLQLLFVQDIFAEETYRFTYSTMSIEGGNYIINPILNSTDQVIKEGHRLDSMESSNEDVVQVFNYYSPDPNSSENINSIALYACGVGKATITLTYRLYDDDHNLTTKTCSFNATVTAPEFELGKSSLIIPYNEGEEIDIDVKSGSIFEASSSNEDVVDIQTNYGDHCTVKVRNPGKAVLTFRDYYDSIRTVNITITIPKFELEKKSLIIPYNTEEDTEIKVKSGSIFIASSSNEDIVDVYNYEDYCTVRVYKPGKAVLTFEDYYGSIRTVNVTIPKPPFSIDRSSLNLVVGKEREIYSKEGYIKRVSNSNSTVVSASSGDYDYDNYLYYDKYLYNSYIVKAKKPGKSTLTFFDQYGTKRTVIVTVVAPKFNISTSSAINVVIGSPKTIRITSSTAKSVVSSNTKVATVEKFRTNDYTLYAIKKGQATITLTDIYGNKRTIKVTAVYPKFTTNAKALTINTYKKYYLKSTSNIIEKVKIKNKKVVDYKTKNDKSIQLIPKRDGKTTITLTDEYGQKKSVKITVKKSYFKKSFPKISRIDDIEYGDPVLEGKTIPFCKVSLKFKGKNYKTIASSSGAFKLKIPPLPIGKKLKLKFSAGNAIYTKKFKVLPGDYNIYSPKWVVKDSNKITLRLYNVHKGDIIQVKIDGKKYNKTITKTADVLTCNVKISPPKKYGIKIDITFFNKFKQKLASTIDYVFRGRTLHIGDSQTIVRWTVGCGKPDEITKTAYGETWGFDYGDDGFCDAFVYFDSSKRVSNWYLPG